MHGAKPFYAASVSYTHLLFGAKMYVDIEILVDGTLTLKDAHQIAETVHLSIEKEFENVKHCMVHVNPQL